MTNDPFKCTNMCSTDFFTEQIKNDLKLIWLISVYLQDYGAHHLKKMSSSDGFKSKWNVFSFKSQKFDHSNIFIKLPLETFISPLLFVALLWFIVHSEHQQYLCMEYPNVGPQLFHSVVMLLPHCEVHPNNSLCNEADLEEKKLMLNLQVLRTTKTLSSSFLIFLNNKRKWT